MGKRGPQIAQLQIGTVFEKWTVTTLAFRFNNETFVNCRCLCGTTNRVRLRMLKIGKSTQCFLCGQRAKSKHGDMHPMYKHGHARKNKITSEWVSWRAMINRCTNINQINYERYGGRGISICPKWLGDDGYQNFLGDMGAKPSSAHQLDRIDNSGNYAPENCRWASAKDQAQNRRPRSCYRLDR